MVNKPADFISILDGDDMAKNVAYLWNTYNSQRREKIEAWKELRNYIFATDTRTTSNAKLPWKNSTTLPKLCQLRDNLHSNYISALFPNDDWLRWEAYTADAALKDKKEAITAYLSNKCRQSDFRSTVSRLLLDYIDYGIVFGTVIYERKIEEANGEEVIDYIGPRLVRISPLDIVIDPTAPSFKESFKIIRSIKTIGELELMAEQEPDNAYLQTALKKRNMFLKKLASYGLEDSDKSEAFRVDGFGTLQEYYQSGYVEILDFYGTYRNSATGEMFRNKVISVLDRAHTMRVADIPSWMGSANIFSVGWRKRPDNLWSMGPLDNLVGLQYRMDHLENLKADAMDLLVHPPLKIKGEVEEFEYGPGSEIHIDENGDVEELAKNAQYVVVANNEIASIELKMEQYAGAPKEAMGIRTPGEKTAFEVQQLQNAAGRIFQEKITTFEIEFLEPVLNAMLEVARRNMDVEDSIRVMDDDVGVQNFIKITKQDITASGKLRPIGARHFAAQAQLMQNLTGLAANQSLMQMIQPHVSGIALAKLIEDVLGLDRWQLVRENVFIAEQQETQRQMNQAGEDLQMEQEAVPPELVE